MEIELEDESLAHVRQIKQHITQTFMSYAKLIKQKGHLEPMKKDDTRSIQTELSDLQSMYDCGSLTDLSHFDAIEGALLGVFERIIKFKHSDVSIASITMETRIIRNLIYYMQDPFERLAWGQSQRTMQSVQSGQLSVHQIGYTEKCMEIVASLYVPIRIKEFALAYQNYITSLRDDHAELSDATRLEVQELGEVIQFFQMTQYPTQYSVVRGSHRFLDLKWKSPSKKQKYYVEYFETPFLLDMKKYYNKTIEEQFEVLPYSDLIVWLGDGLAFETWLVDQTLKFSQKELQIHLREILLLYVVRLTGHPEGPLHMLQHQLYDQLESLLKIISLEVQNVVLVAKIFGDFLITRINAAFQQLPQLNLTLQQAQHIFDQASAVLSLANTICERFADSPLDMFNQDVCRAEFLNSRQRAFEHLLRYNLNLVESMHLLIDHYIRSGLKCEEAISKMKYFISVYDKREQFFTRYGEMLSFRLLDNFRKYYADEQHIIREFKQCVQNEQFIYLDKVLDDAQLSILVSESLNQSEEFHTQIKHHIHEVNLLIVSEIQISCKTNKQCSWFLPQKALEESVRRRRDSVSTLEKSKLAQLQNQALEDQVKLQQKEVELHQQVVVKKKSKANKGKKLVAQMVQMDIEIAVEEQPIKREQKPIEEVIISPESPYCLQVLFELSSQLLKNYKEHRFLTHPLLTMGVAEVTFKCKSGSYFLQMSSPQMVLVLMLDERPKKRLNLKHLRTVLVVDSVEDDVMALCRLGILNRDGDVMSVNSNFTSQEKKIKTRPLTPNSVTQDQQQLEKKQDKQNQQDIIRTFIVKALKKEKRVLIKQLVELITYQAQQKFISCREEVNLILQQLILEQVYVQLDQNNTLYVTYLP